MVSKIQSDSAGPFAIPLITATSPIVEAFKQVIHNAKERKEPIPIVSIGGGSGVGKTTFTQELSAKLISLSIRVVTLHLDDFIHSVDRGPTLSEQWGMRYIDKTEVFACLEKIQRGEKGIRTPTRNQLTGEFGEQELDLNQADLILFEGIYVLSQRPSLNLFKYCSFGIFIEASDVNALKNWIWTRESKKTHPRTVEAFNKHIEIVSETYKRNIDPNKSFAKFVIIKDADHAMTLISA